MKIDFSILPSDVQLSLKRRMRKFLYERVAQIQKDLDSYWQNDYSDTKQKLIAEQNQIKDFLRTMED